MRRLFITTLIGIIVLSPLLPVHPVEAQTGCLYLQNDAANLTIHHGSAIAADMFQYEWIAGAGGVGNEYLSNRPQSVVDARWDFPDGVAVGYGEYFVSIQVSNGYTHATRLYLYSGLNKTGTLLGAVAEYVVINGTDWSATGPGLHSQTLTTPIIAHSIVLEATAQNIDDVTNNEFTVGQVKVCPSVPPPPDVDWSWPLAATDRTTDFDPVESPFAALQLSDVSGLPTGAVDTGVLLGQSNAIGANVHAMTAGTVESVEPLPGVCNDTNDGLNPFVGDRPTALRPAPPSVCRLLVWNRETDLSVVSAVGARTKFDLYLEFANAYLVSVSLEDLYTLYYIVENPTVTSGQTISKGCILGTTMRFYPETSTTLGELSASERGWLIVGAKTDTDQSTINVLPHLVDEPQNIRCGQASRSTGCKLVYNPTFDNSAEGWNISADPGQPAPSNPPGATTGLYLYGGRVSQSLTLDSSAEYTVTVVHHVTTPVNTYPVYTVKLGAEDATTIPIDGTNTAQQTTTIPAQTYTPDAYGVFDLTIDRVGGGPDLGLVIDYVCISDSSEPPPAPAGGCLLFNPEFDNILPTNLIWSTAGTVDVVDGMAILGNMGTLIQSLRLSPKDSGPQDYTITVLARKQGAAATDHVVSIYYEWGDDSGEMGEVTDQTFKSLTATVTVDAETTHDLLIQALSNPTDELAQIDSVCVTTSDGSSPPGYQVPPGGGLTATCKKVVYRPVGDVDTDLVEMSRWLGDSITQIWFCQAKQILMGIWQQIVNILTFLGHLRFWLFTVIERGRDWMLANVQVFARWLNGQFLNLISSIAPAGSTGGGTNFWDALVALVNGLTGLLMHLIDALFGLATALVAVVMAIVNLLGTIIMTLINDLFGLLGALLDLIKSALNAPASLPPGTPICDTSASQIPESCVPIFMLDHTLFDAASPFAFFIPLIEGLAGFGLIWWAWNRFRGAVIGESMA